MWRHRRPSAYRRRQWRRLLPGRALVTMTHEINHGGGGLGACRQARPLAARRAVAPSSRRAADGCGTIWPSCVKTANEAGRAAPAPLLVRESIKKLLASARRPPAAGSPVGLASGLRRSRNRRVSLPPDGGRRSAAGGRPDAKSYQRRACLAIKRYELETSAPIMMQTPSREQVSPSASF